MCFEYGSQESDACVLCKAFGNEVKACPHQQGLRVCQNRINHPQAAYVHFTNAEYGVFNGCGYCKWVNRHPTEKPHNKGWPGCCRRPQMSEIEYIDEKDWPGVSEVFGIANPYQHLRDRPTRPISSNAPQRLKSAAMAAGQPLKRSSIEIHGTKEVVETRTAPASASPHRRGSPKITEQPRNSPRRESQELATSPRSSQTPPRSSIEIGAVGHYRSNSRSSPKETQQTITTSYVVAEEKDGGMYTTRPIQRPTVPTTESYNHGFTYGQPIPRPSTLRSARSPSVSTNDQIKLSDISRGFEGLSLSSTSSNRDSMTTVTSDGFTDYLSEESEAELQRQAEEKAAILRKTRAEEAEFNAARRGLQNIDLRTPAAWTISATRPQPYDPSAYAGR